MTWARRFILVASVGLLLSGCQAREELGAHGDDHVTVTGRLVEIKDDRPADGGVDLTVETANGTREVLRVGSAFIAGPREQILELHRVVDAAKVGDRLRATGHRDPSGPLTVEQLEILK